MPTDPSTDPATATTRRAFLARTAVGGAVATAVLASPLRDLLPVAGAQDASDEVETDPQFGDLATPIELAAVQVYQTALDADLATGDWAGVLSTLQGHHASVASTVTELRSATAAPAVPDPALLATGNAAVAAAKDEASLLAALSGLEDTLSATHLSTLATIADPVTARVIAQVLTSEAQAAAYLGLGGQLDLADLTPAESDTEGALSAEDVADGQPTTTTTTAAN